MTNQTSSTRELATRLADTARELVEAAKVAPTPEDAALILSELIAAQGLLVQLYAELADWHRGIGDEAQNSRLRNSRVRPEVSALSRTTARLDAAAQRAELVEMWLESALSSSGEVQWSGSREEPAAAGTAGAESDVLQFGRGAA